MPPSHIIIADDAADVRALIARVVARLYPAVTISAVNDGLDALQRYEQQGADLLIADYDMPRLNGLDLVRTLRARQVTIPIVMVSALPTSEQQALAAGATRFVVKPFSISQLTQILTTLLPP